MSESIAAEPQPEMMGPYAKNDSGPKQGGAFDRAWNILRPESRDVAAILFYGLLISLLSLTVPVAVKALVDSVAYGELTQQLLVLSLLVFLVLSFSGFFSAIQFYYVELLQRRLFTRYALDLALRIPRLAGNSLGEKFGAEFVNPFLEVIVLHKSLAHLLLGGLGLILQVVVGVLLLAVYHPLLLVFALILIVAIATIFTILGRNGVLSADQECNAKYAVLNWLEDMARMPVMFRSSFGESFGIHRADLVVKGWLEARRDHFRVLFRQNISMFLVHALASSLLLALGGVLVIDGQLSLGQLVAAELVLNAALSGLSKFGKHLESYYDMMAAIRKLDKLRAFPLEIEGPEAIPDAECEAASLEVRDFSITFPGDAAPVLTEASFSLTARECAVIYGRSASGKSVVLDSIYGLLPLYGGQIRLDGFDIEDLTRRSLRTRIGRVGEPEFFHGTVEENLKVGASGITRRELRDRLDLAGLDEVITRLPEGLQTVVTPKSGLFTRSEMVRFSLLRTILSHPGLVMVDQSLDSLDEEGREIAARLLFLPERTWSVLATTNQLGITKYFSSRYAIQGDRLVELDEALEKKLVAQNFGVGAADVSD